MKTTNQCPNAAPAHELSGLDVGSREIVIGHLRNGKSQPLLTLPNTPAGYRKLIKLLTPREATGVYSFTLALQAERNSVILCEFCESIELCGKSAFMRWRNGSVR